MTTTCLIWALNCLPKPGIYALVMGAGWLNEVKNFFQKFDNNWWTTAPALLLLLFFALLPVMIISYGRLAYKNRRLKQEYDQIKILQQQEFENQKEELLRTLRTELENPLILLKAPLEELLKNENLSAPVKKEMEVVKHYADVLINWMDQWTEQPLKTEGLEKYDPELTGDNLMEHAGEVGTTGALLPSAAHVLPADMQIGGHIVIVEDHFDLRLFLSNSLKGPYEVNALANGTDAWDLIWHQLPDLVLMDQEIPGMDGNDLCRKIRLNKATDHIPVIMLTAGPPAEHKSKKVSVADVYLPKPFDLDELRHHIHLLLVEQERKRRLWLYQMEQLCAEMPEAPNDFIRSLYQCMDEHLDDVRLNLEMLAIHTALSRGSLNRKLQSLIGVNAAGLITWYRLKKGAAMLGSGAGLSETAYKCGFSSASSFSRSFTEHFGISTPELYPGG